jgi:ABC-type amino acid transport substrate-binding protein
MQVPTHEQLGIAFAKRNVELCNAVNGVLQVLHTDGDFDKLQARWFSQ